MNSSEIFKVLFAFIVIMATIIFIIVLIKSNSNDKIATLAYTETRGTRGTSFVSSQTAEYFANVENVTVNSSSSAITSSAALQDIQSLYSKGYRKFVASYTSSQIKGDVEDFFKTHKDCFLISTTSTSPEMDTSIENILYMQCDDSQNSKLMAQLIVNTHDFDINDIMIIYRDDTWGTSYKNYVKTYINLLSRSEKNFAEISYDSNLPEGWLDTLETDITNASDSLSNYKIIYLGFEEYFSYIEHFKNNLSVVSHDHYTADGIVFDPNHLEEDNLEFNMTVNLTCVFYYGSDWSLQQKDFAKNMKEQIGDDYEPNYISYFIYHALDIAKNCGTYKDLKKYVEDNHGMTGLIHLRENTNRRSLGETNAVKIFNDYVNKRWMIIASVNVNNELIHDETYIVFNTISFFDDLKSLEEYVSDISFPITIVSYDRYCNMITTVINSEENYYGINLPIGDFIKITMNDKNIYINESSGTDSYRNKITIDETIQYELIRSNPSNLMDADVDYFTRFRCLYYLFVGMVAMNNLDGIPIQKYPDGIYMSIYETFVNTNYYINTLGHVGIKNPTPRTTDSYIKYMNLGCSLYGQPSGNNYYNRYAGGTPYGYYSWVSSNPYINPSKFSIDKIKPITDLFTLKSNFDLVIDAQLYDDYKKGISLINKWFVIVNDFPYNYLHYNSQDNAENNYPGRALVCHNENDFTRVVSVGYGMICTHFGSPIPGFNYKTWNGDYNMEILNRIWHLLPSEYFGNVRFVDMINYNDRGVSKNLEDVFDFTATLTNTHNDDHIFK